MTAMLKVNSRFLKGNHDPYSVVRITRFKKHFVGK